MTDIYKNEDIGNYYGTPPLPGIIEVSDDKETKIREEGGAKAIQNRDAICVGYVIDGDDSFLATPDVTDPQAENIELALWSDLTDEVSKFQSPLIWEKFYPGTYLFSAEELKELQTAK